VAASGLGLELHILHASAERDINTVFTDLTRLQAGGLVIGNDPFFNSWSEQLGAVALRHRVPAIYEFRPFVEAGGLTA
jgi:putative tryptophan/tyrosine transport system substrate-binding protein